MPEISVKNHAECFPVLEMKMRDAYTTAREAKELLLQEAFSAVSLVITDAPENFNFGRSIGMLSKCSDFWNSIDNNACLTEYKERVRLYGPCYDAFATVAEVMNAQYLMSAGRSDWRLHRAHVDIPQDPIFSQNSQGVITTMSSYGDGTVLRELPEEAFSRSNDNIHWNPFVHIDDEHQDEQFIWTCPANVIQVMRMGNWTSSFLPCGHHAPGDNQTAHPSERTVHIARSMLKPRL